jgi:hypothetical protein
MLLLTAILLVLAAAFLTLALAKNGRHVFWSGLLAFDVALALILFRSAFGYGVTLESDRIIYSNGFRQREALKSSLQGFRLNTLGFEDVGDGKLSLVGHTRAATFEIPLHFEVDEALVTWLAELENLGHRLPGTGACLRDGNDCAGHEGFLIGDEAGLLALRAALDAALQNGESQGDDLGDFLGVRKVDATSFRREPDRGSFRPWAGLFFLVCLAIWAVGAFTVGSWLLNKTKGSASPGRGSAAGAIEGSAPSEPATRAQA